MNPPKKNRKRFYILISVLTVIGLFLFLRSNPDILGVNLVKKWNFEYERFNDDKRLEELINKELSKTKGEFAVVVEAFDSSSSARPFKEAHINDESPFLAASLYKLFLMAAVMEEVEAGRLKLDQTVSKTKSSLDKILGGTEFGYEEVEGDIRFTIEEALGRVARISDNYAAILLAEKVGWDKVQQQARKAGAYSTVIKDPITTTAYDISLLLKGLYRGKVVSQSASAKIINFLTASQLNNRIPKYLPASIPSGSKGLKTAHEQSSGRSSGQTVSPTKIAHKTGELARVRHDAGIVYLEDGRAYIIVLMSKNLTFEDQGAEALARVSKVVYDYLQSGK